MRIDMKVMGNRIKAARKARQMTAEQLAERLGMATESLGHIECAHRSTSLQTVVNIADILDVSVDYLIGRSIDTEIKATPALLRTPSPLEGLTDRQKAALEELVRDAIPTIKKFC